MMEIWHWKEVMDMKGILYDARKVKAYKSLIALGEYAGQEKEWTDAGYSLTDLYVWQMNRYNLIRDFGKNTSECNKETMVLRSFRTMVDLMHHPEEYLKRLGESRGMDRL